MNGIEVERLAADDDLAAVARVYVRSWRHAYRGIVPQDFLDTLSEGFWQLGLEQSVDRTFVAREGGEIVGVCTYGPTPASRRSRDGARSCRSTCNRSAWGAASARSCSTRPSTH